MNENNHKTEEIPMKLLVRSFIDNGFFEEYSGSDGEIILSNGSIRVGIFPISFPHTQWRGHILAEHEDNFDKWSSYFYKAPIPSSTIELEAILEDLKNIDNYNNKKLGDVFGTLVRSF